MREWLEDHSREEAVEIVKAKVMEDEHEILSIEPCEEWNDLLIIEQPNYWRKSNAEYREIWEAINESIKDLEPVLAVEHGTQYAHWNEKSTHEQRKRLYDDERVARLPKGKKGAGMTITAK